MKIVFLDIDGVLNSQRTCIAFGGYPNQPTGFHRDMFDEVAIRLIRGIVKEAGAKIVLSSTWRILNHWNEVGQGLELPIIDATPRLAGHRGEEIQQWMDDYIANNENAEITTYAIIDDDSDMLESQLSNFVHTSNFDGFSWENAMQLCRLLHVDIYDVNRNKTR